MTDGSVDDVENPAEGWYLDPYGVHERRWISQGRTTSLVMDDGVEGKDEPPHRPPARPFVSASTDQGSFGREMMRADSFDNRPTPGRGDYADVATDANVVDGSPLLRPPIPGERPNFIFASPFERKLHQRARRDRWRKHWSRWLGRKPKL
jgi:hypothetical protein